MRTLRNFIRSLADLPRGSSADGGRIGVALDAALRAQRAHGAEATPLRSTSAPTSGDQDYTRVA